MTAARNSRGLKIGARFALLAGITLIIVLVAYQGFDEVGRVVFSAGWGIAAVTVFHLFPIASSASAWRRATRSAWRGGATVFLWARLVREAVNGLLPVTQIGGDVVGARLLTFHGARAGVAAASVLVDLTLEFMTQIVFTVIGLGLLLRHGGENVTNWVIVGLAVALPAAAGFALAQRWGLFRLLERLLEWIAAQLGWSSPGALANLHETALSLYRQRSAVAIACLWHMLAWFLGAVEVWLTLLFLDARTGFTEALVIESLGQAIRTAAFLMPGAFGIQETGYLVLGGLFGLSPQVALSVSLIKRIRELLIGVPAMLAWQAIEGRRLLAPADCKENDRG
ncbi:MAG: lysylphosphatidylglycerol synthase domain-containing protein [Rhodospirillales bacterium]